MVQYRLYQKNMAEQKSSESPASESKVSDSKLTKQDQSTQFELLKFPKNRRNLLNKGFLYIFLGLLFVPFVISLFQGGTEEKITLSQLVSDVRGDQVEKILVSGSQLRLIYTDGTIKIAQKEDAASAIGLLESADIDLTDVTVEVDNMSNSQLFWDIVVNFLPILLMILFFVYLFRQARGGQDGIMGIGRSKAKLFVKGKQKTTFKDVGGMDEAKKELEEIVDFLRHPKKYTKVGARTPKGVLLVGPAGTGKTLLARAVAGEAGVQFLSIAGSEFMEMLVGVGASRVRDLFMTAKKLAPSIIFIDEIDAIGRSRGMGNMGGHDEREQTLNQILVEMDGFEPNDNVIVMAATNRGDMLDKALVRPGRFDRRVVVQLPDLDERAYILSIHAKNKPFSKSVDWDKVARRTVGFSGADIENMLNEAAIAIARESRKKITMNDIEEASLKVKLGPSKKRLQDDIEREMTAYHEAGHALVAHVLPNADPVHRISIVSRGRALGFTLTPPERDKLQTTQSELLDRIAVMMGGRAAELIIFNELTAGASNDILQATRIARAMVMEYGMSELGPMNFDPMYDTNDYGSAWGESIKVSDTMQDKIDTATRNIIEECQKTAIQILKRHSKQLESVSKKLIEVESLDSEEFEKLMGIPKAKPIKKS